MEMTIGDDYDFYDSSMMTKQDFLSSSFLPSENKKPSQLLGMYSSRVLYIPNSTYVFTTAPIII